MSFAMAIDESQEYRVALALPGSRKVLAVRTSDGLCLPRVCVSFTDRPGEALQTTILSQWGIPVYIVDYLQSAGCPGTHLCVVGEALVSDIKSGLIQVDASQLADGQMTEAELGELQSRLEETGEGASSVTRFGWLDEAYSWAENAIGRELAGKNTITQYNMGGGFVLLRLQSVDGFYYWIKATSGPNEHEYRVTKLIAEFASEAAPHIVASRDDWNAWLMDDASRGAEIADHSIGMMPSPHIAATALAKLQVASQARLHDLLKAGAFDQRPAMSETISRELFDYLYECMALQISQKVAPLDRGALERTRHVYLSVCDQLSELETPFVLLHGDLTGGNVVCFGEQCRFLDWCEAYVGYPISSLHHLKMFFERKGVDDSQLANMITHYCGEWKKWSGRQFPQEAFRLAPLMAAASTLYGRGDWLHNQEQRERPARRSYSRTLARHMARAAHAARQGNVLCV